MVISNRNCNQYLTTITERAMIRVYGNERQWSGRTRQLQGKNARSRLRFACYATEGNDLQRPEIETKLRRNPLAAQNNPYPPRNDYLTNISAILPEG